MQVYEALIYIAIGVVALLGVGISAYEWRESMREERRSREYRRRL
jgi:hypothetical protein